VVDEFSVRASDEAGAVETVLITISITHRFVRALDDQQDGIYGRPRFARMIGQPDHLTDRPI
jgi:hypothetical protein